MLVDLVYKNNPRDMPNKSNQITYKMAKQVFGIHVGHPASEYRTIIGNSF